MLNLLVFFLFIPLFSILTYSLRLGISPMPTSYKVKKTLEIYLPALDSGTIFELGAGFGGMAHFFAKHYPHLKVIAYELSPIPFFALLLRKKLFSLSNLEVRRDNFMKADLSSASLLFTYLFPKAMEEIQEKWGRKLPHAQLISSTFSLPYTPLTKVIEVKDLYRTKIYFYFLKSVLERT